MPISFIRNPLRVLLTTACVALIGALFAQTDLSKAQAVVDGIKPSEWTDHLAPSIGSATAPIQVVFFVDYQCPSCRTADPVVRQIICKRSDVALIYREFPLHMHQFAKSAAVVAENARIHGTFEIAHKALMEGNTLNQASVKRAALKADVSANESEAIAKRLESDNALEKKAKLVMVPCFVVIQHGKCTLMTKQELLDFLH